MSFVSYAQNFEDVMLMRALKDVEVGFYIDVGANDPHQDSVTKAFYEAGWRGINIEPISQWFDKLAHERIRDINLQIAAGAHTGELIIYELKDTGLSTMDRALAERHEAERGYQKIERKVPMNTLTEICANLHTSPIHFLKIDVEGAEKQVIEGIDFSVLRPWIVLVESVLPNSQIEDNEKWEPILLNAGYEYAYFDGLNRFYIAREHSELRDSFKTPPNYFDGFVLSGDATAPFCNLVLAQAKKDAAESSAANTRVQFLALQLNEVNQTLVDREKVLQDMQVESGIAKAKINELNQILQGVNNSKSWRITFPLRIVMKLFRLLFSFLIRSIRWIFAQPKRIAKRLLRVVIRFVLERSSLKAEGILLLANRPKLKARLRSLAANNGELKPIPLQTKHMMGNPDLSKMTYRAQCIYDELKDAIAKQR